MRNVYETKLPKYVLFSKNYATANQVFINLRILFLSITKQLTQIIPNS